MICKVEGKDAGRLGADRRRRRDRPRLPPRSARVLPAREDVDGPRPAGGRARARPDAGAHRRRGPAARGPGTRRWSTTTATRFDRTGRALGLGPVQRCTRSRTARAAAWRPRPRCSTARSPTGALVCALDERGRDDDLARLRRPTRRLARRRPPGPRLRHRRRATGSIPRSRGRADFALSFGPMVWPHMLVRVMLAEQLYRAASILAGSPYHRGLTGRRPPPSPGPGPPPEAFAPAGDAGGFHTPRNPSGDPADRPRQGGLRPGAARVKPQPVRLPRAAADLDRAQQRGGPAMTAPKPVVLCILDGWGLAATRRENNAPELADTPDLRPADRDLPACDADHPWPRCRPARGADGQFRGRPHQYRRRPGGGDGPRADRPCDRGRQLRRRRGAARLHRRRQEGRAAPRI